MIAAAHSADNLSIRLEALLGVIIIIACVVYVFRDNIPFLKKYRKDKE
jgi:hypothetical protein